MARDVNNFLEDFASNSGGKVKIVRKYPDDDEEVARFAQLLGVPPVRFNVQSQGELTIKEGYLGLSMTYADQREIIQFIDMQTNINTITTSPVFNLVLRIISSGYFNKNSINSHFR